MNLVLRIRNHRKDSSVVGQMYRATGEPARGDELLSSLRHRWGTIPNPLFGHHPLLGQSHIVTPYIETQPGLKLGRSVTPAPCTARGITATQLYQPLVSAMVLLECIVLKIWLKCIKITM